jgi:hypothetical protein
MEYANSDWWHIEEDALTISGDTSMANFDMYRYLRVGVKIPRVHISYDSDDFISSPEEWLQTTAFSDFIIAFKGSLTEELHKAFQLPEGYILGSFDGIEKTIQSNITQSYKTEQEYLDNLHESDNPLRDDKQITEYLRQGYQVCIGSIPDEDFNDTNFSTLLYHSKIDYRSENLIFHKK